MRFIGYVGSHPLIQFVHSAPPQEYADRAYSVNSFFLVYLILEIPFEIVSGLLFSLLLFATNLQRTASMYFLAALVSFCIVSCGESLGIIFNTLIADSTGFALNITSSLISIAIMCAGELSLCMLSYLVSEIEIHRYLVHQYACVL